MRGEAALVGCRAVAVHLAAGAVGFVSRQALLAEAAGARLVTPADTLADFEELDVGPDGLDGSDAFVAEDNVAMALDACQSFCDCLYHSPRHRIGTYLMEI